MFRSQTVAPRYPRWVVGVALAVEMHWWIRSFQLCSLKGVNDAREYGKGEGARRSPGPGANDVLGAGGKSGPLFRAPSSRGPSHSHSLLFDGVYIQYVGLQLVTFR